MNKNKSVHKFVDGITFGLLSPKMIRQMSKAKVVTPELYDKEGYPVDGGLMDVKLGVIDPGLRCKTDGQKLRDTLGHFGHMELARPVIHIHYNKIILNLLRCTCKDCGRILVPDEKLEVTNQELEKITREQGYNARRNKIKDVISDLRTVKQCPHCDEEQEKVSLDKPTNYHEGNTRLSPIEIRSRLETIPDGDLPVFGINPDVARPEWMVVTLLPIPPVPMRPSITLESGERSEDDLTHKLGDIVRINQRLFENINAGAPEIIVEDLWDLLQYHVTTFLDNNVSQLPPARHRSGQTLKTLTGRIKSKEGRIRGNLVGKRANFSARTVISPDPKIDINEVGVPERMARKLTVPERVTEWNIDHLKKFIENGPDQYPGSNYIVRPDGRRKRITDETKEQLLEELQPGFVVERHLQDGDIALFNRQPSLHRMSMMCHKVKVLPGLTLRLNPAVCAPYNADFDGDEMNLHIPQTEEARAEAETLMQVQTQIISPRYGLSIIACIQDSISGNYLLTREGFEASRQEAIDLLASAGITNFEDVPQKETLTGKEIFSVILPNDFNFEGTSKSEDEPDVVIQNGQLEEGVMDAANLGEGSGLMLRKLHKKYGADRIVEFLRKLNGLGSEVLLKYGFTSGIGHMDLDEDVDERIKNIIDESIDNVQELIQTYQDGDLEPMPGRSDEETLELRILEELNNARNKTGDIVVEESNQTSNTMDMIKSGARGNTLNLAQMGACVGQQALRGGRIGEGYQERSLTCFPRNDRSAKARGFIKNSFKDGLEPHELFFMAMTGRDSLMDTALRTPKSGYLYRRLANSLQDLKVEYDFTVRDASNKIVQFAYGEDGLDVSKTQGGELNIKQIIREVQREQ
jgi:DNA-directed RNA polymerase subunit A'